MQIIFIPIQEKRQKFWKNSDSMLTNRVLYEVIVKISIHWTNLTLNLPPIEQQVMYFEISQMLFVYNLKSIVEWNIKFINGY